MNLKSDRCCRDRNGIALDQISYRLRPVLLARAAGLSRVIPYRARKRLDPALLLLTPYSAGISRDFASVDWDERYSDVAHAIDRKRKKGATP